MTMALPKGRSVVAAGLAAITGAGVALGFTELGSSTSTWLLILATAIPLAVSSPFVAGWLSPELNPNPPKDTDGRREESGRGVRELQGK